MKIEFTKEQFETLLKTVYLGYWMANAYDADPEGNKYSQMLNYILGHAKQFGLDELVDHDEKAMAVYPSAALEEDEDLGEIMEEYGDNVFLEKLIYNLAGRDMLKKHGEKAIEKMTDAQFFKEEGALMQKYQEEISKNGLKNLSLSSEPAKKRK